MELATINDCIETRKRYVVIHDLASVDELTYYGWYTLFYDPVDEEVRTLGDIFESLVADMTDPPVNFEGQWHEWFGQMVADINDEEADGIEAFLDWCADNNHDFYQFDAESAWTFVNTDSNSILLLLP